MDPETAADKLRVHNVVLRGKHVCLRPLTGQDSPLLQRWSQDPEVLHYAEGEIVEGYAPQGVKALYRGVSQHSICFVAEAIGPLHHGEPIGAAWLHEMGLPRLLERFPGENLRRIDLILGEKGFWGRGLGAEIIELLTWFAFEDQQADRVFGCGIADSNARSVRAFEKNGYRLFACMPQPRGGKTEVTYDMMLTRKQYLKERT